MANKNMKRVGWMPVCVGGDGGKSVLGPWPGWIRATKKAVLDDMWQNNGVKFKIVPVYYDA